MTWLKIGSFVLLIAVWGSWFYFGSVKRGQPLPPVPEATRIGVSNLLAEPLIYEGQIHLVNPDELISSGTNRDNIPSLTNPAMESIATADMHLSDDGQGVVVVVNGQARFYPFIILAWHEIINDTIAGQLLAITYCPLCQTSVVFERTLGDQILDFGVSGLVWNNNSIMYDRTTNSLWSQLLETAIVVDQDEQTITVGTALTPYPSELMTWAEFKTVYPNGQVLSRITGYERDYTQDPYWSYHESNEIMFALYIFDGRLPAKQIIYGTHDRTTAAAAHVATVENSVPAYWFCWVAAWPKTEVIASEN